MRFARRAAAAARRRAGRYLLTTLGDALSLGAPSLQGQNAEAIWSFTVSRSASGEYRGELRLNAETGEVSAWLPTSAPAATVRA